MLSSQQRNDGFFSLQRDLDSFQRNSMPKSINLLKRSNSVLARTHKKYARRRNIYYENLTIQICVFESEEKKTNVVISHIYLTENQSISLYQNIIYNCCRTDEPTEKSSRFFFVFFFKSPQQKRRNIQKNSTHETSRNLTFGNHSGCLFRWRLVEVNFPFSAKTGNVCECVFYIVPVQPKKEERTNERTFSFNI